MTTILTVNIDDIDNKFVETLKRDFAHAEAEIRVEGQSVQHEDFTESDFWNMMSLLDWKQEEDDEKIIEPVVALLSKQPLAHIYRFSDLLAEKFWQLDTRLHAQVFLDDPEEEGYLSSDDFLYARCAVVANGPEYYEQVLHNPGLMPADVTFEPLLYIAMTAYEQKTGKKFIGESAYNYETYSNKEGWSK